jgi:hypothetical protein
MPDRPLASAGRWSQIRTRSLILSAGANIVAGIAQGLLGFDAFARTYPGTTPTDQIWGGTTLFAAVSLVIGGTGMLLMLSPRLRHRRDLPALFLALGGLTAGFAVNLGFSVIQDAGRSGQGYIAKSLLGARLTTVVPMALVLLATVGLIVLLIFSWRRSA